MFGFGTMGGCTGRDAGVATTTVAWHERERRSRTVGASAVASAQRAVVLPRPQRNPLRRIVAPDSPIAPRRSPRQPHVSRCPSGYCFNDQSTLLCPPLRLVGTALYCALIRQNSSSSSLHLRVMVVSCGMMVAPCLPIFKWSASEVHGESSTMTEGLRPEEERRAPSCGPRCTRSRPAFLILQLAASVAPQASLQYQAIRRLQPLQDRQA